MFSPVLPKMKFIPLESKYKHFYLLFFYVSTCPHFLSFVHLFTSFLHLFSYSFVHFLNSFPISIYLMSFFIFLNSVTGHIHFFSFENQCHKIYRWPFRCSYGQHILQSEGTHPGSYQSSLCKYILNVLKYRLFYFYLPLLIDRMISIRHDCNNCLYLYCLYSPQRKKIAFYYFNFYRIELSTVSFLVTIQFLTFYQLLMLSINLYDSNHLNVFVRRVLICIFYSPHRILQIVYDLYKTGRVPSPRPLTATW